MLFPFRIILPNHSFEKSHFSFNLVVSNFISNSNHQSTLTGINDDLYLLLCSPCILYIYIYIYRGADKSLARPGRKQSTATEDFLVSYILFIIMIGGILVLFIYTPCPKKMVPFFLIFFLGAQCVESGVSCTDCY